MKYNIYINKNNRIKFAQETNKSGLINTLLSEHYNMPVETEEKCSGHSMRINCGSTGCKY